MQYITCVIFPYMSNVFEVLNYVLSLQIYCCPVLENALLKKMSVCLPRRREVVGAGTGRGVQLPLLTLDQKETTLLG